MEFVENIEQLASIYGAPGAASTQKVARSMIPAYRTWINRSRFCILSTVGPEGTDASPRGDEDPVVLEIDETTLALPDWQGNQRIDSLRNIVRDPRVSLMFMVAGSNNVVRLNGTAKITVEAEMTARFEKNGRIPRSVIVIRIGEIYFQCARALLRAKLWTGGDQSDGLPTPGKILAEMTAGRVGGDEYDTAWPDRAAKTMW